MNKVIEKLKELVDLLKLLRHKDSYKVTVKNLYKGRPDIPFFVMHKGEEFIILGDLGAAVFSINKCRDKKETPPNNQDKDVIIQNAGGFYKAGLINLRGVALIIDETWSIGKILDTATLARASTKRA